MNFQLIENINAANILLIIIFTFLETVAKSNRFAETSSIIYTFMNLN